MSIDIRVAAIEPVRQTFSHVARRLGADKPASRYQEATFDLQSDCNFHYRPLWEPDRELYDRRRTAVTMADWYAFRDPRQFYYGAYVLTRARQQEVAEKNLEFVEKHGQIAALPKDVGRRIRALLLPLRHVEYAANLNNCYISAYGWGTAVTQATTFAMMDRLAIAQQLSKIGLLFDEGTGESLEQARRAWLDDPVWQPLRRHVENTMVIRDWFELFVAQDVVLDGLLYPLVYGQIGRELLPEGAGVLSLTTEFMQAWFAESQRWVDALLKVVVVESDDNRRLVTGWIEAQMQAAAQALQPYARLLYLDDADALLAQSRALLTARLAAVGLDVDAAVTA